jgi:hypothetical protein
MGHVPKFVLSASASPDGWPEKGRHIGGGKKRSTCQNKGGNVSSLLTTTIIIPPQ